MFVGLSSKWLIKLLVILMALSGFDSAELPMRRMDFDGQASKCAVGSLDICRMPGARPELVRNDA
jgi:hypothetical protein